MTLQSAQQLVVWGFLLTYGTVMGLLMSVGIPALEGHRLALNVFVLLPLGAMGGVLIVIGKLNNA
jgi:hypothetical protein